MKTRIISFYTLTKLIRHDSIMQTAYQKMPKKGHVFWLISKLISYVPYNKTICIVLKYS